MRNQTSHSLVHLIALFGGCLALATSLGCGDDTGDGPSGSGGSGGSGSSTSGTSTASTATSTTTTTTTTTGDGGGGGDGGAGVGGTGGSGVGGSGGSGVGGTGGSGVGGSGGSGVGGSGGSGVGGAGGGPDVGPELVVEIVGDPAWEPVDFHQISVEVGDQFSNFENVINGLLPSPDHEQHPDLGVGPGAPHDGFDTELATNVAAEGYVDSATFTQAEGLIPNGILSLFMLVPTDAAPTGSSPDFDSGPIIPNEAFPLGVELAAYQDGELLEGYSFGFDVPALDDQLDPPFDVDGHSHVPLFNAIVLDGVPELPGEVEVTVGLSDANGDGYNLSYAISIE